MIVNLTCSHVIDYGDRKEVRLQIESGDTGVAIPGRRLNLELTDEAEDIFVPKGSYQMEITAIE